MLSCGVTDCYTVPVRRSCAGSAIEKSICCYTTSVAESTPIVEEVKPGTKLNDLNHLRNSGVMMYVPSSGFDENVHLKDAPHKLQDVCAKLQDVGTEPGSPGNGSRFALQRRATTSTLVTNTTMATWASSASADTFNPLGRLVECGASSSNLDKAAVDFGGSWICVRITGDMEAFLVDMGLSETLRNAARHARYGTGRQVQNIAQVSDAFVIQNILKAPVTMRFRVGGGVQESVDQEGKPILIEPSWDGDALRVTSKRENGELIAHTRRFFEGEFMVLELTSPSGSVVSRVFERR